MAHVIKTGNIVTPPAPKVTARKSVTVKIGNGDAPDVGGVRTQSMTTFSSVVGYEVKAPRQNLATTIARTARETFGIVDAVPVTRTQVDVEQGVVRETWTEGKGKAKKEKYRAVRTVEMGDAPLPTLAFPTGVVPTAAPAPVTRTQAAATERTDRAAAKAERDAEILAFVRARGYKGSLNADIRVLALDAMEQARQVAEYAAR